MRHRTGLLLIAIAQVCLAAATLRAQPSPNLNTPPTLALKQGQSIEQALSGQHLGAIASASVADARGVSVSLIKPPKPDDGQVRVKISVAPDAALGDRELRLISPAGVTRPVRIFVSQYDVISEKEPNNQLAEAQDVQLPATIVGRIDGGGDVDQFRFAAKQGQELIFDVNAARIGAPLEAVATLHAANGRELRARQERRGGDPVIIFTVPEDGQYVLRLRDLEYRGGPDYDYRINAGQIPFLEAVMPSSGEPGKVIEADAIGHNLASGQKITVDLTLAAPGQIDVRAKTATGWSNPAPFEVTELPQVVESKPDNKVDRANVVSLPAEISGRLDGPADEGFFKFHVAYRQPIGLDVLAGRFGSPVTPLLQLRNAHGDVIESNDGAPDADARIARELDPGDYIATVRDLTYAGGAGYWYRLRLERATHVPQDFTVRFLPDAPRLHRGGNLAMWCEVKRLNGFHGDVTITAEGLPPGVSAGPIVMPENASGWFTLAAAPDAALGTVPIHLRASATIGTVSVAHEAEPELDGRPVRQAYLTVLDPAPFTVEAVATMTPQRIEQMNGQIGALAAKLAAPDPRFDASLAEWEKKVAARPLWTALAPMTATSSKSTPLRIEADGSVLAGGNFPAQDQYTITAFTDLKQITAVRLEVLADERLPAHGPGAAPNGNFVLSEFRLSAGKEGQPPQPVAFSRATADFSQQSYPIAAAIDGNPGTGWAVDPQQGRDHMAIFQLAAPLSGDGGTNLVFALDQISEFAQHNLGRFRLSVTSADPATLGSESELPPAIADIVAVPRDSRTQAEREQLIEYFRTVDPQTASDRTRLEALRDYIAPYAEMERLQKALGSTTPQLEAQQEQWEKSLVEGAGWSPLDPGELHSSGGSQLHKEPDDSIFVDGPNPPSDTYTLSAAAPVKGITAIQLEALADARLPANGPGRAGDGNFVLSRMRLAVAPKPAATSQPATAATQPATQPTTAPSPQEVTFDSARATFEQQGFAVAGVLDDKNETGWAIAPNMGQPAQATFYLKQPLGDAGSMLTFTLEHLSKQPQHGLGSFRIWVTTNRQPDAALRLPRNIAAIARTPAGARSEEQKREIATYFRSIAPALAPLRQRLADLRATVPAMPFKIFKKRPGAIPVPVNRAANFKGDVQVTLIGFSAGREGDQPIPITRDLKLNPLVVNGDNMFGTLTCEAEGAAETGTRMVVLKAEAKVGEEQVVEYSPAFPLTIEK